VGKLAYTVMIMDISYAITPFVAWFFAGVFKFIVNCIKARTFAFEQIGYGGFPSNHSAIVSSMAVLVALKEGIGHPAFGVAITLAFIVMLDAYSLRRQLGKHAVLLNQLASKANHHPIRERMGHTCIEILAGLVVGSLVAVVVNYIIVERF
jgi:uncharacterized protein